MSISISGNSSSTLLGMLNTGKESAADSIISANIKASRERVNNIIEKYTKVSMTTDTEKYEKVATAAQNVEKFLAALQEPELYEESVETIDGVANKFVDKYNSLITYIDELGGNIDSIYSPQLENAIKANLEKLEELGITTDKDGKLELDKDKLKAADTEKIKSLFSDTDSYGKKLNTVLTDVSELLTKALKIKQAQSTNYGKSGSYINQLINSTLDAQA